ncbi:MAG: acetyl-CoA carboxylase biotin carboxyl carrier protein [Hyphomonadaceae bacterium]
MSEKKASAGGIEPDLVRELAAILSETGLTEIEVEHGELKLRLAKTVTYASAPAAAYFPPAAPAHAPAPALSAPIAPAPTDDRRTDPGAVLSPMVGTAYLSPEPGAQPFIRVGDTVSEGQTLMVVEAMKTFNPIPAPRAGKIKEIIVSDAQPVEYGEALVILE